MVRLLDAEHNVLQALDFVCVGMSLTSAALAELAVFMLHPRLPLFSTVLRTARNFSVESSGYQ